MTEFLVKCLIKDYDQVERLSVRTAYGMLASVVGIFCNVLLFAAKLAAGILTRSVSVTADAFNNLSDAGSSIVGFIGVKMASKPADEQHPFGHGRIEYITALVVAFLILEVGITFFQDSFSRIRHPEAMDFKLLSVIILLCSVAVKLWLGLFNRKLGKRIGSKVMMAAAADAAGDMVTTLAAVVSLLVYFVTGVNIDGYVGMGVALVIIWAGVSVAKDTLAPLIGEAVNQEDYEKISQFVEKYPGIVGSHDLIVHNYGPGRSMASIHAEVPNDIDVETSHEVIDRIERDAAGEMGIFLVIHMDPVETRDVKVLEAKKLTEDVLKELDPSCSIHDFRMVDGKHQVNLIFDMMVPYHYNREKEQRLCREFRDRIRRWDERFQCVITVEKSYVAAKDGKEE